MRSQAGFTLVELVIVLMILGLIYTIGVPEVEKQIAAASLDTTAKQSEQLLRFLEMARRSTTASSVSGTPAVTTHTYFSLAAGSTVSDFETATGVDTGIRDNNPFGSPYSLEVNATSSTVLSELPAGTQSNVHYVVDIAGTKYVSVTSASLPQQNPMVGRFRSYTNHIYLENTR